MKNRSEIKPFIVALRISIIYFFISILGIYLSNNFLLSLYEKDSKIYIMIQVFRPYVFTVIATFIIFILVYKNFKRVKNYEEAINSNLKEIRHKEIDLYQAEYRINNQKYLIDNIIKSASILVLTLDEHLNIKKVNGSLDLFTSLKLEDVLGKRIDIIFETPIDIENISNNNIKGMELKLLSNSCEDKYALMDIDFQNNKFKNKIEYNAFIIDITQRKLLQNQIQYLDYYDSLTDLPNRVLLEIKYKNLKNRTETKDASICFLYIDIDDFKHINESLSHHAGDEFLVHMSNLLEDCISKDDILARITQDEFAIILTHINSREDIEKVIHKIYEKNKKPWVFNGIEHSSTVTIGISVDPFDGEDFDTLLKNSNLASEYLKNTDRGNYQYYSKKLEAIVLDSLKIINDIKRAIANDEFVLYYQTFIDLKTEQIMGVEALVRWIHPERGMIPPLEFIPVVEKTILTYDLMNTVFKKALKQKKEWNLQGIDIPKISVNVSSKSFSQENFHLFIEKTINEYGLKNSEIVLELTESGFSDNLKAIESNIKYLRSIGVEIAMDDFGTGYSTLSRLKSIPIDYLKLDKTFIDKMTKDSEDEIMVKSVISLASTFGLKVLAEGIETKEQFDLLKEMNCDFGQGYYMSKPLPAEKLNIK